MSKDIVTRLRDRRFPGKWSDELIRDPLSLEAADAIEALRAQLRNALPAYEGWMDSHADDVKSATCRQLTFGEIRTAYALLGLMEFDDA